MGVTRILDLIVIILLATILLMPRPDATVKPALNVDGERRERVAELQSILMGHPDDAAASLELANIYLDGHRPDWALAAATTALRFHGNDYRLHHLRAIAYADRFESAPAFEAAAAGAVALRPDAAAAGRSALRRGRSRAHLALGHDAAVDRGRRHEERAVSRQGEDLPRAAPDVLPKPKPRPQRSEEAGARAEPLTGRDARRQHPPVICLRP